MKKRLLSTIAASALIAAQVVTPVMAADGTINVNVSDKEAVIRVVVPTALEIAVDQFETVDAGTQIYSEPFTMVNKSAVPVKVSVASTATATADLVSKVSDVNPAAASANGKAWLAVAAQTSDGKYIEESGKGVGDLTEASGNVTVFDATSKKASQDFYLAKGSGNAAYKLLDYNTATTGGAKVPAYAKYYKLTAETLADDAALQAKVDAGDVYYEATTGAGTNGNTLTKIAKGTAGVTKDANSTYYSVATAAAAPAAGDKCVYAEMGTAGANTAFRYIGKLEDAKASWSKTDISAVKIEYDIDGVTASNYEDTSKYCTYGLYSAPGTDMTAGTARGSVQYVTANVSKVVSIKMTNDTGTYDAMVDFRTTYSKATSATSGANTIITFDPKYTAFYSGNVDATIVYEDAQGKTKTQVLTLNMSL